MDREEMSNEENYAFDVAGYLHVPGVLSRGEVEALNRALDEAGESEGMLGWEAPQRDLFRDLLVHPQLVWYLNQIIGHGFRLDQAPRLLGSREGEIGQGLVGGDEPRNPSRAYFIQNGRRSCQGVKAIWVLEDVEEGDGGLVVVQASHKSNVEITRGFDDGTGRYGAGETAGAEGGRFVFAGGIYVAGDASVDGFAETAVDVLVCGASGHPVEWTGTGG